MESFIQVFFIMMDIISSLHHTLTVLISELIRNICNHLLDAGTVTEFLIFQ